MPKTAHTRPGDRALTAYLCGSYSPNSMVLTKNLKYDDSVVHMNGEQISSVGEIRLLARAAKATWGLSPEVVRTIYITDRAYRFVRIVHLGTGDELYEVRRSKDLGDTFVERELERPVYFGDLPHPAHVPEIGYESVEDLDSQTVDRLAVVGLHIHTDGSRIEGKVGAALTEWRDGEETWYSTLRLDPFCTVFQAEMVALQKAIRRMKNGNYDKFPLSYAKNVIRAASLKEWQFRVLVLPWPREAQDVLHVLEKCPMFLRERVGLETEIGVIFRRREFPTIVNDDKKRE
ncbi:hypothetical protein EVAR_14941_1, partial [Eumeta japonica]